ncbi:MAG TPA: TrmJ/YjtD family RNA methyltransferase [Terriglobia bacterium]|nr:TrmJ/YjtD family RNA methyltransferase [Terriglobia bacterium]
MLSTSRFQWRVVLARPRNPLNIGAAARAMANFGFSDLVVVDPFDPVWREARSAVGAEDLVRSARCVKTLSEALESVTLVVGTTTGARRSLPQELMSLTELPAWLRGKGRRHRAAILFGPEKTGLTNEHLSFCHVLVRIPTSPRCPSMNLGQSVAVCAYELARAGLVDRRPAAAGSTQATPGPGKLPGARVYQSSPASVQSLDHILLRGAAVLDRAGYLEPKTRQAAVLKLRRLLLRMDLTNYDAKVLGGVLAQVEWKLENP